MPEPWNPFAEFFTPQFRQRDLYDRFVQFQELYPSHPQYMDLNTGDREYARNQALGVENSDELYKHLIEASQGADSETRNRLFNSMMVDDPRWQEQWSLGDKTKIRETLVGAIDPAEQYAPPKGRHIPTRQLTPPTRDQAIQGMTDYAVREESMKIQEEREARQAESPIRGMLDKPYVRETLAPALSMIGQIPGQAAVQAGYTEAMMAPGEGAGAGRAVSPGFGREAFSLGAPPVQTEEEAEAIRAGVHDLARGFIEAGEKQQAAVAEHFPEPEVQRFEEIEGVGDAVKYTLGVVSNMAGFVAQAAAGRAVGGPPGAVMAILPAVMSEASQEVRRVTGEELRPDLVLPAAMASAALEYAGFETLSGAVTKNLRGKITARLVAGLMAATQVGGVEGMTEWSQEFINLAVGRIADEDRKLFDKLTYEERSRLANAAMAGVIGGLLMSGGGSAMRHQYLDGKQQADVDNAQGDIATIESLARTLVEHGPTGAQVRARAKEIGEKAGVPSELFEQPETGGAVILDAQGQPVETGRPLEVTPEVEAAPPSVRQEGVEPQAPVEGERRAAEPVPPPETLGQVGDEVLPDEARAIMDARWDRAPEILKRDEFRGERTAFAEGRDAHVTTTLQDESSHGINKLGPEDIRGLDAEMIRIGNEIDVEFGVAPAEPTVVQREPAPAPAPVEQPVLFGPTGGVVVGTERGGVVHTGAAFAERAIPEFQARIEGLNDMATNTEAFAQSEFYDGSYPLPREGGLLAATQTQMYATDPQYKAQIDAAIVDVADTLVNTQAQLMTVGLGMAPPGTHRTIVDDTGKVRGGFTADPLRAWKMEAMSKYKHAGRHLGNISVREGVQNAVDAVVMGKAAGTTKRGKVEIIIDGNPMPWGVGFTIIDNGIGMSDVDIRDVFLSLHSTGKDIVEVAGGFGTGKAVALVPNEEATWELFTRDNYYNSELAKNEQQIQVSEEPIVGTKLVVKSNLEDRDIINSTLIKYLETSEMPKWIDMTVNGKKLANPFKRRKSKSETHEIELAGKKTVATIHYYPNPPTGSHDFNYNKSMIVRLVNPMSGVKLTQAVEDIYNTNFNGAIVVDIETEATPGEEGYPLDNSRLKLESALREPVDGMVGKYAAEGRSAQRATQQSKQVPLTSFGRWGAVATKAVSDPEYLALAEEAKLIFEETEGFFERAMRELDAGDDSVVGPTTRPFTPLTELIAEVDVGYKGPKGSKFVAMHMLAYETAARLLASRTTAPVDYFYPLFSKEVRGGVVASQYGRGRLGYNPYAIRDVAFKEPLVYAVYLKDLIDHELTHYFVGDHTEDFTSRMGDVQLQTATMLPYLVRLAEKVLGKTDTLLIRNEEVVVPEIRYLEKYLTPEQMEFIYGEVADEGIAGAADDLYFPLAEGDDWQLGLFRPEVERGAGPVDSDEAPAEAGGRAQQPGRPSDDLAGRGGVAVGTAAARESAAPEPVTGESAAAAARGPNAAEAARKRRLERRGKHQLELEKEAERKEKRKIKAEARAETKAKAKRQAFIPTTIQQKILDAIRDDDLHTISEIEEQTGINKGAIRTNFRVLAKAGEIELGTQPTGRGDSDRQYASLPGVATPADVTATDLKAQAAAKKEARKVAKEETEATKETEHERVKREYEEATTEREQELEDREKATQAGMLNIFTTKKQKQRDADALEVQSEWRERYWRDYIMRGGPAGKGRMSAGQKKAMDRTGQLQEAAIKEAQADRRLIDDHVRKLAKTRKDRYRIGRVLTKYLAGYINKMEAADVLGLNLDDKVLTDFEEIRKRNSARHQELLDSGLLPMDVKAALQDKEFYLRLAYARFLLDKRLFARWRRYQPTEVDKKLAIDTMEAAFAKAVEKVAKATQEMGQDLPEGFDLVTFLKDTKWKNTDFMLEKLNNPKLAEQFMQLRSNVQRWTSALQFERSLDGFGVRAIRNADSVRDHAEKAVQNLLNPRAPLEAGTTLKNVHNLDRRTLTEVFKKLYGEIEDPGVLQALTVETQGNILAQARFFDEMLMKGEGLVWTREQDHERLTAELGKRENETDVFKYGSLAGSFVTPEFKNFLEGKGQIHASLKDLTELGNPDAKMYAAILGGAYQKLQGTTRMMALMTMGAWWRNLVSSYVTFALQSGDAMHPGFNIHFAKSVKTAMKAWVGTEGGMRQLSKDMESGAFNYTQASIVTDLKPAVGVTAQRLWEGDEPIMSGWRVAKNVPRKLKELYILIDYAAKKAAWTLRHDIAIKKGLSEEMATQHAREHVEKYYQNANRVPAVIQALGVAGTADFLGFKYDSGRMAVNALNNVGMSLANRKKSPEGSFAAKWKGVTNEHPELMDTWQPIVGFTAARIWPMAFGLWGPGQYLLAFGSNTAAMSVKGVKLVMAATGFIKPDDEPEEEITEVDDELQAAVNEITESYNANMPKWTVKAEGKDGEKSIIMVPLGSQFGNAAEDFMLGYAQRLNSGESAEEILESNTRPENLMTWLPIGMTYSNIWEAITGFDPQTQFRQDNLTDAVKDWRAGRSEDALDQAKGAFINFIADTAGGLGRSFKAGQVRAQRAGRDPQKGVTLKKYDEDTVADTAWEVAKPLVRLLRIKKYDEDEVIRVLPYKMGSSGGKVRGSRIAAREAVKQEQRLGEATNDEIARSEVAMLNYVDGLYDAETRVSKMMPLFEYLDISKEKMVAQISDKAPVESALTKAEAEAVVYGKVEEYLASDDMYKPEAKPTRLMKGDDFIRDMLIADPRTPTHHIVAMMRTEGYDIEEAYKSETHDAEDKLRVHINNLRRDVQGKKQTTLYD